MFHYRDAQLVAEIAEKLKKKNLNLKIMHVCGTHQDTIVRYGLDRILRNAGIDVREGPGCPVCVTTTREIEEVRAIAEHGVTIATYGDMAHAPGMNGSLFDMRSEGKDIRIVYSIEDAVKIASSREVVFFAAGFETTAPSTAHVIKQGVKNFYVYSSHRLTPPAVKAIASMGKLKLDGLILPGHVSTIVGAEPWKEISSSYKIPQVIAGFEPLDVMVAVYMIVKQIEEGRHEVENEYKRVVNEKGNEKALALMNEVFKPDDIEWRGFPVLPESGLELRQEYDEMNAKKVFEDFIPSGIEYHDPPGCRCGEVIRGEIYPWQCPLFGRACKPSHPVGPCMVSAEGACAIEYKYGKANLQL